MDTLAAFDLIDAIECAMKKATASYGGIKEKTRLFLDELHQRGLKIQGEVKPANASTCHEVGV